MGSRRKVVAIVVAAVAVLVAGLLGKAAADGYGVKGSQEGVRAAVDDFTEVGVIAENGADYSKVAEDGDMFVVCDEEADGNIVKGIYDYRTDDGGRKRVEVADSSGADGECAVIEVKGPVMRHQVCERNHVVWSCGNQQAGSG